MSDKFIFKGASLLLIPVLWLFINSEARSQNSTDDVDISFGIKTWDPVHIKIEEKTGSAFSAPIRVTALNSTYYPFNLTIDFIQFDNLSPKPPTRENKVTHGTNNLFTFSIQVPENGYGYRYTYSYWITSSSENLDEEFPYIIPLAEGKMVESKKKSFGSISDSFTGKKGDTIYCMRRGLVTAVPRTETLDFRLSQHDCLEVLHDDGTYMIYHYLQKSENFTAPGKIALPGQPIGRLSDSSCLDVTLMKVIDKSNLMVSQPIRYSIGKAQTLPYNEMDGKVRSVHPLEVITREMKSKELKEAGRKR